MVGLGITGFFFWLIFRDVDFAEVWAHLREANWGLLLAAVAVATAGFLIRAMRWKVLLTPVLPNSSLRNRFAAVNIGFMANNLLPARVGEFARAYALSKVEPIPLSAALGSLVVERVLDALVLFGILFATLASPAFPSSDVLSAGPMGAALKAVVAVVTALVFLLVLLLAFPRRVVRVAERMAVRLPRDLARRVVDALESFLGSLGVLRSPRLLALALLWSVGFWLWHGLSFWLAMLAFDIHAGPVAAYFTEAVVAFGVAVPAAPGFFGTFHYWANWALSVFGVPAPSSLAFAFGYHLGGFIPVTLIGLYYASRIGLSLKDVGSSENRVEDAVERERPGAARALAGRDAHRARARGEAPPGTVALRLDAPAKVNLALHVLGRRADGYHDLETLFQAVDLSDELEIRRGGTDLELSVEGEDAGPLEQNLVLRAARAYLEAAGPAAAGAGLRIHLVKRIPMGAGLGGGSSDAAATLRVLDRLFEGVVAPSRLAEIAASLGCDVPFFLASTPLAIGRGRGELLEAVAPLPAAAGVVLMPPTPVSTAAAYRALDQTRAAGAPARARPLAAPRAWDHAAALAGNDFEKVVAASRADVAEALAALRATGPLLALLCGSGAACFALYRSQGAADEAARALTGRGGWRVLRVRTLAAWPEVARVKA